MAASRVILALLVVLITEGMPLSFGSGPFPAATQAMIIPMADIKPAMPRHGTASVQPASTWEFAFVSGNGRMGAMVYGNPADETVVGNHCRLFLPLGSREVVPDLARYVPELRQIIRDKGYKEAMTFFLGEAKEQGFPGLIWTDPFHPGFELKIKTPVAGELRDYVRSEDFQTGEVSVQWMGAQGRYRRRLFVSRPDNVIVLSIAGPAAGSVTCELSMPAIQQELIDSTMAMDAKGIGVHNIYVKGKGGYDVYVRVAPRGGSVGSEGRRIQIEKADEVVALMRIVPFQQGEVLSPDKIRADLEKLPADYDKLFAPHAKAHAGLFDRVRLDLGGGEDRYRTGEELLDKAAREGRPSPALLERMYDAGRYMFICASGELPPNLQGIWSGTWKPAWSGDFTTDTNLQLAIESGFSANLPTRRRVQTASRQPWT